MKLRTEILPGQSDALITHKHRIYLCGSCFSENISQKLVHAGFHVLSNSHGIIYNPVSIARAMQDLFTGYKYGLSDLNQEEDRVFSYSHHGSFDSKNAMQVLQKINQIIHEHREWVRKASFVFVTLGTSWVYEIDQRIVANCHKVPAKNFTKRLLSSSEINSALQTVISSIRSLNNNVQIVFTLSPVKHLAEGFVENQHSKSLLHSAIQEVLEPGVQYFPAYEIMQDDLRDYRFWEADMVHPNKMAIDYIWEKFMEVFFSKETRDVLAELTQLKQFLGHRPLTTDDEEIIKLENEKSERKETFISKYPQVNI